MLGYFHPFLFLIHVPSTKSFSEWLHVLTWQADQPLIVISRVIRVRILCPASSTAPVSACRALWSRLKCLNSYCGAIQHTFSYPFRTPHHTLGHTQTRWHCYLLWGHWLLLEKPNPNPPTHNMPNLNLISIHTLSPKLSLHPKIEW